MTKLSRRTFAWSIVALAAVLFLSVNIASEVWLRSVRLDLTQNRLYTLSPGTKAILSKLKEPVTLRFYFSGNIGTNYATLRAYATRVRDLLHEYVTASGGKIILEEIDPAPFTQSEDDAVAQGLTGAPTQEGETIYFGLVGTNTVDGRETVPFFSQDREPYLEYDLSSIVFRLSQPEKPTLGIISGILLQTGDPGVPGIIPGNQQTLVLYSQLRQNFSVLPMSTTIDKIPDYVNTLVLVHPAGLSTTTQYAVDQFVLRGGHAIVIVDPYSEINNYAPAGPLGPQPTESDLKPLLAAWGVQYDVSKVVGDPERAIRVQMRSNPNGGSADYIVWMKLEDGDFNTDDPVTGNLHEINFGSPGAVAPLNGATTKFVPLAQSSSAAGLLDALEVKAVRQPQDLMRDLKPSGRKVLAARISGPAKSAFPGGAPKSDVQSPAGTFPVRLPPHIAEAKNIDVIVIADSDIFDDRFWVQTQNVLGSTVAVPTADNGAFVQNAVENMMGSSDLISLRTRVADVRPFTVVTQLRRTAEAQYSAQEQQLRTRLTQTETRLRQLQSGQGGEAATSPELLSPQAQAEIEKFRRDLLDVRARLREVQANLRKDVEALGNLLAFLNIALVPFLVAAAAVALAYLRRKRRAAARGLT